MKARTAVRFGLLALAAAWAALLVGTPGKAHALQGAPDVATNPQNIGETSRVLESLGAYDVPGTSASPGSVGPGAGWSSDAMLGLQQLPAPGTSTAADQVGLEIGNTAGKARLLLRGGLKFVMGGVAGFVVVEAGSYILGKIFSPADVPRGPIWDLDSFELLEFNGTIPRQCYVTLACDDVTTVAYTAPRFSRVILAGSSQNDFYYCLGGNDFGAYGSPTEVVGGIPASTQVVETYQEPPIGAGTCGTHTWQHFSIVGPIAPAELHPFGAPVGPGGSQVGSVTVTPCSFPFWTDCPTSTNLEQRIKDELDSGRQPMASAWLDHYAEPENYPDPTVTATKEDHRCDRAPGPLYKNPGGNTDPPPFTKYYATPFSIPFRPPHGLLTEVYLHYGKTYWLPGKDPNVTPKYLDDWPGWGYRHIKAKHGWSAQDLAETEQALQTIPLPDPIKPSNWNYTAPVASGQGGVACTRRVAVDFGPPGTDPDTGVPDPRPRGIVTSFNIAG